MALTRVRRAAADLADLLLSLGRLANPLGLTFALVSVLAGALGLWWWRPGGVVVWLVLPLLVPLAVIAYHLGEWLWGRVHGVPRRDVGMHR